MSRRRRQNTTSFDPDDVQNVKHTRIGVWDFYEDKHSQLANIPGSARLETLLEMAPSLPYVRRMFQDLQNVNNLWPLLCAYLVVEVVASLVPAVALWYSSKLLKIVETAMEKRMVDADLLLEVVAGRILCATATRVLKYAQRRLGMRLNWRIKAYFSVHTFHSRARLDAPTFDDPVVQRQLEDSLPASGNSMAWDTISAASRIATLFLELVSRLLVLVDVLSNQRDGPLLAFLCFGQSALEWSSYRSFTRVWAATTKNKDFIRMEGMKRVVNDHSHRKEFVAGHMSEHMTTEYRKALGRAGDEAGDFYDTMRTYRRHERFTVWSLLREPFRELPQIVFTLRAVQYPASIPVSLASLNLIQQTAKTFSESVLKFIDQTGSMADTLSGMRKLYEIINIPNRVKDGRLPFPEDQQAFELDGGVSIEFQNVSFRYPGSDQFALHNVSFRIEKGQLCVIVGANGSGKSTILALIVRIHDPTTGVILLNDKDIRTLLLADLRRMISVLFQDYTHFPLSIAENIGLGDPAHAHDMDKVHEAARLGGAEEFITQLPRGFQTYLEPPVQDYYSGIPDGTKTLFGKTVDYSRLRGIGEMSPSSGTSLSGGQMQRLAVSRTFMRSLFSAPGVGLLLFDEPSASLDPTAEHDLFQRLRDLRGHKTMVFSSHRFGNLTRHADRILYLNNSVIAEEGTHDELLKQNGEYARIWMLQAKAFL